MDILERGKMNVTPERRDLQYALACAMSQVATTTTHYEHAMQWADKVTTELGVLLVKQLPKIPYFRNRLAS